MAHAGESADDWPTPCVPFFKTLAAVLPAGVDARAAGALNLAEYQVRAGELCAILAQSGGEKARMRKVRSELGGLLRVVAGLYDYLKTTALASGNVYFGGLLNEIDQARAHVGHLSAGVDEERAGWHSEDTYTHMLADFRYAARTRACLPTWYAARAHEHACRLSVRRAHTSMLTDLVSHARRSSGANRVPARASIGARCADRTCRRVFACSAQLMDSVCPNKLASTVEECTERLTRLEQSLTTCPSECTKEDRSWLLCAVLDLSISRFTDAPLAPNFTCAADSLKGIVQDFEKGDTGKQYWGNYNGVTDVLTEMQQENGPLSGAQHRESADKYAALLRPPTDLADASIDVMIQFLTAVKETKAALDSAKPTDGEETSSLVAWLTDGMLGACVPWLGKEACSDLGIFVAAVSRRFEELYASGNLRNAVMCALQMILNNATDLVHGAKRCETWRATHLSAPRVRRLREREESQSEVQTEVFTACKKLFAPPEQASPRAGKHARDTATLHDGTDSSRDVRLKRHCERGDATAGAAAAAGV